MNHRARACKPPAAAPPHCAGSRLPQSPSAAQHGGPSRAHHRARCASLPEQSPRHPRREALLREREHARREQVRVHLRGVPRRRHRRVRLREVLAHPVEVVRQAEPRARGAAEARVSDPMGSPGCARKGTCGCSVKVWASRTGVRGGIRRPSAGGDHQGQCRRGREHTRVHGWEPCTLRLTREAARGWCCRQRA